MKKNQIMTAIRYLLKHKAYSLINIIGLTIGLTAFWQVLLFVQRETSYDHFHTKGNQIYRASTDIETQSEKLETAYSSGALAIDARQAFPEIASAVRIAPASLLFTNGSIKYQEENCLFADSGFFNTFSFPLIEGNPTSALVKPYEIVLSQSTAKKYFGKTNPIGKSILLSGGKLNAKITGVMKDLPGNSQIKADIVLSMPTIFPFGDSTMDRNWSVANLQTFFLLRPDADPNSLEQKLAQLLEVKAGQWMRQHQTKYQIKLEPIKNIYLHSKRKGSVTGNLTHVYIFSIIGLFIILIAGINFINLSTARSTERAKEVGVRKLIGASKKQLMFQFFVESIILTVISYILSIILTSLLLPVLDQLAGKRISQGVSEHPLNLLIMFSIALLLGIAAGIYPAIMLSSFKPITVLKGNFSTSNKGLHLRRGLVTLQFTICIGMIIATIVVYNQLNYMENSSLGFNNDQILVIDTHWDQNRLSYRDRVDNIPQIKSTALTSNIPGDEKTMVAQINFENNTGVMQAASINQISVDYNYIPQFNMHLIAGRNFHNGLTSDSTQAMLINERLVHYLGFNNPAQAIGQKFSQNGKAGTIIGVLKDFHFRSFKESIQPLSFVISPDNWRYLCLKLSTRDLNKTLTNLEDIWKTTIPQRPFSYYFADDYFEKQYRADENFGRLFICFSILTILISCLGLIGLSSYTILQKRKEIGIRKLLGATIPSIISMLSREYLQLILMAFVLASITIWYPMHAWLEAFPFRSTIHWWIFLIAGGFVMIIAFITISIQIIKAAVANPVHCLKTSE